MERGGRHRTSDGRKGSARRRQCDCRWWSRRGRSRSSEHVTPANAADVDRAAGELRFFERHRVAREHGPVEVRFGARGPCPAEAPWLAARITDMARRLFPCPMSAQFLFCSLDQVTVLKQHVQILTSF